MKEQEMGRNISLSWSLWTLIVLFVCCSGTAEGYDVLTHRGIAERAVDTSLLDGYLRTELGFQAGTGEIIFGESVRDRIGLGARFEDEPFRRVLNHFHNPLQPWGQAGLRVGFQLGQSSVLWQQNANQDSSSVFVPFPLKTGGGNWSWQDARRHYLNALIRPRKEDRQSEPGRDSAFVDTFRALGQLTHLVQDATVPAHVRNDPHLSFRILGVPIPVNPDWYEDWAERKRDKVIEFINLAPVKPPFSIFRPTGDSQAPVPVARLIDNDKFQSGDFSILLDSDLGTAEYTNGNFLSRNRMFGTFALPRTNSLDLANPIVKPVGTKWRRYFRKVGEGEAVEHFVAESMLFRSLLTALAAPPPSAGWMMDDLVQEDYGRLLLPRAVGYSASLLDYFFRGKLDVDLVPDPQSSDPTVVKLSGTNGSPDALVDGILALYADGPQDTRSAVPSLEPLDIKNVAPGQEISRRFQVTEEAERFIAVYRGTLGNEVKDPTSNFPGGVIGKVLGGVRAESIFAQGDKRMLRTVDGVFQLPNTVDRLRAIQWGDQDNTFVGNLSGATSGPDELLNFPDQGIFVFKINRSPGSPEVPLVNGTNIVSTDILKVANFPFGLSLGVTVNYSQSVQFRQFLFTYQRIVPSVWDGQHYVLDFTREVVIGPTEAETVIDETFLFAQNFSIILDQAHRVGGSTSGAPYSWSVQEVAFDRQGRILALVKVSLGSPDNNRRTVKLRKRNQQCQLVEDTVLSQEIRASILGGPIWALIDVEKAEVLGVSSSPTSSPSTQGAFSRFLIQEHFIGVRSGGGPLDGSVSESCVEPQQFVFGNPSLPTVETARITVPNEGTLSQQLTGKFRADLELLVSADEISTISSERVLVYSVEGSSRTNRAIRLVTPISIITRTASRPFSPLVHMVRPTREGSAAEIVFLFTQVLFNGQRTTPIEPIFIRWSPEFPSKTGPAIPEKLPASDFFIFSFATPRAALLEFEDLELVALSAALVDFDSGTFQIFPDQFLSRNYVLLDPKFLYNINDTKFHTLEPSLQPTVLPRSLAPAPNVFFPRPSYHLIKLQ